MLVLALCSLAVGQQIPPGTVLPVMLNSTLDARRAKPGAPISGNLMQDVPLPDGSKISKGSKILGHVESGNPAMPGSPSRIAFIFDRLTIGGREIPITTHLSALASAQQVFQAKLPTNAIDDYGTSTSDWNTIQIGGAGVYRGNGEVVQGGSVVGHATHYGAVTAKLIPSPKSGCSGDGQSEQALWLFSPWACGVYGYSDVKIVKGGAADSTGAIELESPDNIRIDGGSGWLLRTNGSD
jgi:hypothetical protein